MAGCCSFTASRDRCFRLSFSNAGLKSTTTDLGKGTIIHCWVPKTRKQSKLNLLLIHGIGANAMWQWNDFISPLAARFNVYVPDLIFFGDSFTTRPDRSESFQAQCIMALMNSQEVPKMNVVGISYGGFVGYSMAVQFPERLDKLVLCCAGVCLEAKDMDEGLFKVNSLDEAISILLPLTPEKMRELLRLTFLKPAKVLPTCFLNDFINRTLIIWGDQDQVFPLELAHRLKRHVGDSAKLVVLKNSGHAVSIEKPKELYKHIKSFLADALLPS